MDLVAAIRAIHRGEVHLHPDAARQLLQQVSTPHHAAPAEQLTPRELEVLEGIARGRSNKEIAADLGIREKTQAALFAVRHGLVRLDA